MIFSISGIIREGRSIQFPILMKGFSSSDIKNKKQEIYKTYKHDLTPYANASRDAFKKVVALKSAELSSASDSMNAEISFYEV